MAIENKDLIRTMAKALAEVCLYAHVVDRWVRRNVDLPDDEIYQSKPWYALALTLPVSEEALMAIIAGSHGDWDADVAALAEYIAAAVMGAEGAENIFSMLDVGKPISPLKAIG